jgi:hypothetical protein
VTDDITSVTPAASAAGNWYLEGDVPLGWGG